MKTGVILVLLTGVGLSACASSESSEPSTSVATIHAAADGDALSRARTEVAAARDAIRAEQHMAASAYSGANSYYGGSTAKSRETLANATARLGQAEAEQRLAKPASAEEPGPTQPASGTLPTP